MRRVTLTQYLVEQAGGAATDGRQRIGVILGSKNEVGRVTDYHSKI